MAIGVSPVSVDVMRPELKQALTEVSGELLMYPSIPEASQPPVTSALL